VAVLGLGRVGHGLHIENCGEEVILSFPSCNAVILSYPIFFWPTAGLPSQENPAPPLGLIPQKLYPNCHACLAARHVEKFRGVNSAGPKFITANTLNFKPIFECS